MPGGAFRQRRILLPKLCGAAALSAVVISNLNLIPLIKARPIRFAHPKRQQKLRRQRRGFVVFNDEMVMAERAIVSPAFAL
jgi:hypothetical protein